MRIEKRTMGWIQKPSAYQYNQQLNAKRHAMARTYLDQQSLLAGSLFSVSDAFSHDAVALTLESVTNRLKAEAKAKIDGGLGTIDDTRADLKTDKTA